MHENENDPTKAQKNTRPFLYRDCLKMISFLCGLQCKRICSSHLFRMCTIHMGLISSNLTIACTCLLTTIYFIACSNWTPDGLCS